MVSKLAQPLLWAALSGAAAMVLSAGAMAQTAQPAPDRPLAAPGSTATENAAIGRVANQAQGSADSAQLFERLDRNGDGYLSADELASQEGDWIAVDRDRDGRIGRSEFKALR
jgi:EF hand domain-containing protein